MTDKKKSYSKLMNSIKNAVGNDYKDGISIVEVWLEKGVVCARLKNGEWYHYTYSYTWY